MVGSENLFTAAADVGVGRVVYTSSVATLGLSNDGTAASESAPSTEAVLVDIAGGVQLKIPTIGRA